MLYSIKGAFNLSINSLLSLVIVYCNGSLILPIFAKDSILL
jgi:hypothetical protein